MEPETDRYAVLDPEGVIVNIIVWDGRAAYDPGPDRSLFRLIDEPLAIGDNVFAPDPVEERPGFFRRLIQRLRRS